MNEILLSNADLDEAFHPKMEWLISKKLFGLLFLNVPGKDEFTMLIGQLESRVLAIAVGHAEFGKSLTRNVFENSDEAYSAIFALIHENIFVEVVCKSARYLIWMPEEHDFYALFGSYAGMDSAFSDASVKSIRDNFDEYIANDIFNDRAKRHLLDAQRKYMTFEKAEARNKSV